MKNELKWKKKEAVIAKFTISLQFPGGTNGNHETYHESPSPGRYWKRRYHTYETGLSATRAQRWVIYK